MPEKGSKTVSSSIEETRRYHTRYLRAINSPVRREVLRAIKEGCVTVESLRSRVGLDAKILKWHLSVLEHGYCVEKEVRKGKFVYRLTQEGQVVDYLE